MCPCVEGGGVTGVSVERESSASIAGDSQGNCRHTHTGLEPRSGDRVRLPRSFLRLQGPEAKRPVRLDVFFSSLSIERQPGLGRLKDVGLNLSLSLNLLSFYSHSFDNIWIQDVVHVR